MFLIFNNILNLEIRWFSVLLNLPIMKIIVWNVRQRLPLRANTIPAALVCLLSHSMEMYRFLNSLKIYYR